MVEVSAQCKITSVPNGGFAANKAIAQNWLGLTLPCEPELRTCEGNKYFAVFQEGALAILAKKVKKGPDIVLWYETEGYPQKTIPYFYVPAECAEFVPAPEGALTRNTYREA